MSDARDEQDDLAPDVRTTTERRLAALEAELPKTQEESEKSALEKKMQTRYRGVKFFGPSPSFPLFLPPFSSVLTVLNSRRAPEGHSQDQADEEAARGYARGRYPRYRSPRVPRRPLLRPCSSSLPSLSLSLLSLTPLRIPQRFPRTDKYIALFPDGTYVPHTSSSSLVPSDPSATPSEAATKRASLRASIRRKLEAGELPSEPETGDLGIEGEEDVGAGVAGEKREREEETKEEVREKPAQLAKKRKVEERVVVEEKEAEVEEEEAADEEAEIEVEGQPKKKENRKQRKERKRAEQAGGAAPSGAEGKDGVQATRAKAAPLREDATKGEKQAAALAEEDDFFA